LGLRFIKSGLRTPNQPSHLLHCSLKRDFMANGTNGYLGYICALKEG